MKLLFAVNIFNGFFLSYLFWTATSGQYFEDPTLFYKPMEFDTILRGSYNITQCMVELLQCYELMKPEIMCERFWIYHDSICSIQKGLCHDYFGKHDAYRHRYILTPYGCRPWVSYKDRDNYP